MTDLLQRSCLLEVGDIAIKDHAIAFSVQRSLKKEPNTAEIHILNLNAKEIGKILGIDKAPVKLSVGYADGPVRQLFSGSLIDSYSKRAELDIDTVLECGDGEWEFKEGRINKSYKDGTPYTQIVVDCVNEMGIGIGNLAEFSAFFKMAGSPVVLNSLALDGKASEELTNLLQSCQLSWSIQDGALQLHDAFWTVPFMPLLLINDLLIESPEIGSGGSLRCRTLIDTRIVPGVAISVAGRVFRAELCSYNGATHADEWTVDIEGSVLQGDYARVS